jgi:hypothetical protein
MQNDAVRLQASGEADALRAQNGQLRERIDHLLLWFVITPVTTSDDFAARRFPVVAGNPGPCGQGQGAAAALTSASVRFALGLPWVCL